MPYVVFVDWRVLKCNTTNIHVTDCGHYQRHIIELQEIHGGKQ